MAGRRKRVEAQPEQTVIPSTALVASAARYSGKSAQRIYRPTEEWQKRCYRHYSICGEARYAAQFFGRALSRASLHTTRYENGAEVRNESGSEAEQHLLDLFNGHEGREQMLSSIGTHLVVAGECYLIGRRASREADFQRGLVSGEDVWEVVSTLEIDVMGKQWQLSFNDGTTPLPLSDSDVVIRIWTPHPERRLSADSPFRSMLPVLDEIEWLTKHIFAQAQSRLAGAGMLLLPQEMEFPPPPESAEGDARTFNNEAEAFMATLAEAMMTPIEDPSNASSLVPLIVTAPGDVLEKAQRLTFWTELDAASQEMRNNAIHRFALGMDLPPEQIEGMSSNMGSGGGRSTGVSHWGQWQIDESTIKMHVEPMLDAVVNALTICYLRPLLPDGAGDRIRYDTARLRLRPDRSREAIELWDRGALSTAAMLRENGFGDDDAMDEKERQSWLLLKVASGSATPEQVHGALAQLGVNLPAPSGEQEPRESRPSPSLEDHEQRREPEMDVASLLPVSEALVYRALERAGNRLRQRVPEPPACPSYETHTFLSANGSTTKVMEDAFPTASLVLKADVAEWLVPALRSYCSTLLTEQAPHDPARLRKWLERSR